MSDEPKAAASGLKPRQISEQNDVKGLHAIHRFRWLRSREIGNVLWPNQKNRHTSAARLIRKWVQQDWVIERKLPEAYGPAYVLSQRGANFLQQHGITAKSGKRVGVFLKDKSWVPNRVTYKHDLLANGFMTFMLGSGANIKTEFEIAEANPINRKIPDGLVQLDDDWIAIEVERERKTGENARKLAQHIIDISNGDIIYEFDEETIFVDGSAIVYENAETGGIDHFPKIKRMLQSRLKDGDSLELRKIVCEVIGGGYIDAKVFDETVRSDWNLALLKSVDGLQFERCGSEKAMSELDIAKCRYLTGLDQSNFDLILFMTRDGSWHAEISKYVEEDGGYKKLLNCKKLKARTEEAALRQAKEALIDNPEYREWHHKKYKKAVSMDDL